MTPDANEAHRPWSKLLARDFDSMTIVGTPPHKDSKAVRHIVAKVQHHVPDWTGTTEASCRANDEANIELLALSGEMAEAILAWADGVDERDAYSETEGTALEHFYTLAEKLRAIGANDG